ncbi:Uncharacterised protein [Bordetella pertussis]|nr:Uncharacterised protein [Bordetella pertussis]
MPPAQASRDRNRYWSVRKNSSKRSHSARWKAPSRITASSTIASICLNGRGKSTKRRRMA